MPGSIASAVAEVAKPERPKPILAVTGSQRPYIFDLPHLLSLPEGFEFRFRYRHSWIERGLASALVRDVGSFAGREAIVLYHSQESRYIIPIRKGTIIGLEELGPLVLFRFRVGPFAQIELDLTRYMYPMTPEAAPTPAASSAARALSARARDLLGPIDGKEDYDLSQSLPSGWYLREAARLSHTNHWDQGDVAAAWARAVAVLHEDRNLFGIPFFYLLGFRTEAGATVKSCAIENRFSLGRERIHGFSLQESERYRMRVLEWCEPPETAPHPRVRLDCEFQQAHLALKGASNLVVGRYDVVEFTFSAQQPGYSEVGLRADSLDKEEKKNEAKDSVAKHQPSAAPSSPPPGWSDWPTIFAARVPVVVKPKAWTFITAALVSAIGLGLYIWLAPKIGPNHPTWQRFLEVVSLAILLLGWRPFAEHLDRFLKLSGGLHKLRGDPKD